MHICILYTLTCAHESISVSCQVAEVQQRVQLLALEAGRSLGDLNGDLEKLRRCDEGFEAQLPGLKDLRGAVEDEQKRRQMEHKRFSERLQDRAVDLLFYPAFCMVFHGFTWRLMVA